MTARVPDLYCPIPSAIGDHADILDEHVARWMADNRLYASPTKLEEYRKSKFATFAVRTCPHPRVPLELMKLYTEWLAFGFYYDDQFFDGSAAANKPATVADAVIAVVSAHTPPGGLGGAPAYTDTVEDHSLPVLRDLLDRTAAVARPDMFERLRTSLLLWWLRMLWYSLPAASS